MEFAFTSVANNTIVLATGTAFCLSKHPDYILSREYKAKKMYDKDGVYYLIFPDSQHPAYWVRMEMIEFNQYFNFISE